MKQSGTGPSSDKCSQNLNQIWLRYQDAEISPQLLEFLVLKTREKHDDIEKLCLQKVIATEDITYGLLGSVNVYEKAKPSLKVKCCEMESLKLKMKTVGNWEGK